MASPPPPHPAHNLCSSFNFDIRLRFWIPSDNVFSSPTFGYNSSAGNNINFNHNTTDPFTYNFTDNSINVGAGYTGVNQFASTHEVRYLRIQLVDIDSSTSNPNTINFKDHSENFKFAGIDIYEQFDTRDFSVEFNDSVLDTQGWTGPRYSGCKTIGEKINTYTAGDTTYGLNPNLENKTTAIYISNTLIGGRTDQQYTNIAHHSYINIEKILIVDLTDDSVRVLDRGTEPFDSFHRFVTTDFPTGGSFSMKLIDESTQSNLKDSYKVKMNKGWLIRSFAYDAGHGPLPGVDVDGGFLNAQNISIADRDPNTGVSTTIKHSIANPLSLFDAVSGSIERDKGSTAAQVWGITDVAGPTIPFDPSTNGYPDATDLGCTGTGTDCDWITNTSGDADGIMGVYGLWECETENGEFFGNGEVDENDVPGKDNSTGSLSSQFNFYNYGTTTGNGISQPIDGVSQPFNSTYEPISVGELRFRYGVVNKVNLDTEGSSNFTTYTFQPLYIGNNTEFVDNKFTRQFVNATNNQQTKTRSFKLNTVEDIETLRGDQGLDIDYKFWVGDKNWNPSMTASVFIGNCVQHLNENADTTELHLTLFQGTKDFSGRNDELSISTFEVDKNLDPDYLSFEGNIGPVTKTIGPRLRYLKLKNQPRFKPTLEPASFTRQTIDSTTGTVTNTTIKQGKDRIIFDTIETHQFRAEICEKQNAFVFGPGTTHQALSNTAGFGDDNYCGNYKNHPANSQNFSGSFSYELSFLDKDHTLIADVDIVPELFDGIGGGGVALIPEHTHEMVKLNLEYYLFKVGLNENNVTKRFITNND